MKVEFSPSTYTDLIELWVCGLYIALTFYSLEYWHWHWYIKKWRINAIRFELPTLSVYIDYEGWAKL